MTSSVGRTKHVSLEGDPDSTFSLTLGDSHTVLPVDGGAVGVKGRIEPCPDEKEEEDDVTFRNGKSGGRRLPGQV